jgi:predicted AlkP superfamily pyrophosphatase or phosphodiesterase
MIRALAVTVALAGVASPASCQPAPTPRLVVMLTVDQLSPEYFERFGPQLTGGLARIIRTGVYYPGGLQDHAMTSSLR